MEKNWKPQHNPYTPPAKKAQQQDETESASEDDEFSDQKPSKLTSGPRKTKLWIIGAAIIIALLILFLLIIPGIKGYSVYKAMKASGVPEEYLTNMQGLQEAKTTAEQTAAQAQQSAQDAQKEAANAQEAKTEAEENVVKYMEAADRIQGERDAAIEESESKNTVIENAANRLCCIARVENPSINAYAVIDDKITCVSEGGESISC